MKLERSPSSSTWRPSGRSAKTPDFLRPSCRGHYALPPASHLSCSHSFWPSFAQVAYSVSQRSYEIGIRVALGASRPSVVRLMMGQTLALVVCGTLLGIAATAVQALDAPACRRSLVKLCIAALACLLPSWRAIQNRPGHRLRA